MLEDRAKVDSFTSFVREIEPRLRHSLIPSVGLDAATEATAEALAYGWEHWDRLRQMDNPAGYLYRVAKQMALASSHSSTSRSSVSSRLTTGSSSTTRKTPEASSTATGTRSLRLSRAGPFAPNTYRSGPPTSKRTTEPYQDVCRPPDQSDHRGHSVSDPHSTRRDLHQECGS